MTSEVQVTEFGLDCLKPYPICGMLDSPGFKMASDICSGSAKIHTARILTKPRAFCCMKSNFTSFSQAYYSISHSFKGKSQPRVDTQAGFLRDRLLQNSSAWDQVFLLAQCFRKLAHLFEASRDRYCFSCQNKQLQASPRDPFGEPRS